VQPQYHRQSTIKATLTLLTFAAAIPHCPAQTAPANYPTKPIRLVVPLATGGGTDITARVLAQRLSEIIGHSVVVDNRPGASGVIGTEIVAKSPADGYTLLLASNSFAANPSLFRKLPYDPVRDFTPVSLLAAIPFVLVVHPSLPVRTAKDFVALAKARPRELNHGSSGSGTGPHLGMEVFMQMTRIELVHIVYKGAGAAMNDLIAGQIHAYMAGVLTATPHIRSGRVRALGVSRLSRSAAVPEVPTLAEAGFPGLDEGGQMGIVVPAATAPDVVQKLHRDVVAAMRSPNVVERIRAEGGEVLVSTPQDYAEILKRDVAKWSKVIRAAGIPAQ
jgi:tripartite-type tricarboxylate transporter receptor subunit TctC